MLLTISPALGVEGVLKPIISMYSSQVLWITPLNKFLLLHYWPRKENQKFIISMGDLPNRIFPKNKSTTADVRLIVEHLSSMHEALQSVTSTRRIRYSEEAQFEDNKNE